MLSRYLYLQSKRAQRFSVGCIMMHRSRTDNFISWFCTPFPQPFLTKERSLPYGFVVLSLNHITSHSTWLQTCWLTEGLPGCQGSVQRTPRVYPLPLVGLPCHIALSKLLPPVPTTWGQHHLFFPRIAAAWTGAAWIPKCWLLFLLPPTSDFNLFPSTHSRPVYRLLEWLTPCLPGMGSK